jgi:hypothetical protein
VKRLVRCLGLGVLVGIACERPTPRAGVTSAPEEAGAASRQEASFLEAVASGASEDEARGLARLELARALLGDPAWLDIVPIEVHDPGRDPVEFERLADGSVRVKLGLSRERAAEVLSHFTETEIQVEGPSSWRETLHAFFLAHVASNACERRRALFGSDCESMDASEANAALVELVAGLSLAPSFVGGVPLDPSGRPLRAPGTYVLWRGHPAEGVPLVARWSDELTAPLRSDARGHAVFGLPDGAQWPGTMTIGVDASALLGPVQATIPTITVSIEGRPTDLRRWGALIVEGGVSAVSASVLEGLADPLGRRGLGRPVEIPKEHGRRIAQDGKNPQHVVALGDALGGRLDVLLVIEVDSRFVNRMGGTRVWYQARGKLDAYETWSGRLLTTIQETVNGSGLSNERADEAARRALGEALGQKLLQSAEIPKPPVHDLAHARGSLERPIRFRVSAGLG